VKRKYKPYNLAKLGLARERMPHHIAIIMDGNGRWARMRGMSRIEGHKRGARAVKDTVRCARRLRIKFLTLYSFSKDNWKRPTEEVSALMSLLKKYLASERKELLRNGIKLMTTGDIDDMPEDVKKKLLKAQKITKRCKSMTLNLALSYSGRGEILKGVRKIAEGVSSKKIKPENINEKYFSQILGLPDVDLLIRTSGETRVSDFLLWQIPYAEFYITNTLWPDFRGKHLIEAIKEFQRR
jgi:undecaprenyl diphosphate synthase